MNLLNKALEKNELVQFILGQNEYFILNRETGEHWPYGLYRQHIVTFLSENDDVFSAEFWDKICGSFGTQIDLNLFIENIVGILIPYYNTSEKKINLKRTENTPKVFIDKLIETILSCKEQLKRDTRGSGVEWNSNEGLWGSIRTNLKIIHERGGPNFMTDDLI